LGISLKVISGDNQRVAAYVGRQVGLMDAKILTGSELLSVGNKALAVEAPARAYHPSLTHRRLQSSCSGHKRQRFTETDGQSAFGSVSTNEKLRTSGHHTSLSFS
jgi:hypothetical protein